MSASIFWRPVNSGHQLRIGAPSSFIDSLQRAFGSRLPVTLTGSDRPVLLGMAAATEYEEFREAYSELARALGEEDEIQVFASY
jgi:hypothetical protein